MSRTMVHRSLILSSLSPLPHAVTTGCELLMLWNSRHQVRLGSQPLYLLLSFQNGAPCLAPLLRQLVLKLSAAVFVKFFILIGSLLVCSLYFSSFLFWDFAFLFFFSFIHTTIREDEERTYQWNNDDPAVRGKMMRVKSL